MSSPEEVLKSNTDAAPPDRLALAGAAVTAVLSFTPIADAPGSVFIAGACLFWAAFVLVRARQDRDAFRGWGFRADNLWQASILPSVVFVVGAAGLAGFAWLRGTFRFPAHGLPLFLVYPAWGLIQQFLLLGIVVGNLERLGGLCQRKALIVLIVALIFGLVHAFNVRLVAATFFLGLVIVPMYLQHRNLWPLGVLHGWLGGLFYLWVENRDLWAERFG
jgi:uncharacterized protein